VIFLNLFFLNHDYKSYHNTKHILTKFKILKIKIYIFHISIFKTFISYEIKNNKKYIILIFDRWKTNKIRMKGVIKIEFELIILYLSNLRINAEKKFGLLAKLELIIFIKIILFYLKKQLILIKLCLAG